MIYSIIQYLEPPSDARYLFASVKSDIPPLTLTPDPQQRTSPSEASPPHILNSDEGVKILRNVGSKVVKRKLSNKSSFFGNHLFIYLDCLPFNPQFYNKIKLLFAESSRIIRNRISFNDYYFFLINY